MACSALTFRRRFCDDAQMPGYPARLEGTTHRRGAIAALALLTLAACDPFGTQFADSEPAVLYRSAQPVAAPEAVPERIRVMTWNIKFGAGRSRFTYDCGGTRSQMTRSEVIRNLEALANRIRTEAPDLVLLQEVDTARSRRAAYLDQVQYLLDRSGLTYAAYASQWKARYVPSEGIGPVDSGNAVFSRWPVVKASRHALPLQKAQSWLERYFYLKRNLLEVHLAVPSIPKLAVVATHSEAYSRDGTKKKHLQALKTLLDELSAGGNLVIGGGDLNSLPPGSPQCRGFAEEVGCEAARFPPDDYCGEESWLTPLYGAYRPDVAPAAFARSPDQWYTFVGDQHFPLNRKLDHLFASRDWTKVRVLQDAILLSDHVPVVADLSLR